MMQILYKDVEKFEIRAFVSDDTTDPIVLDINGGDRLLEAISHFFGIVEIHKNAVDCPLCENIRRERWERQSEHPPKGKE